MNEELHADKLSVRRGLQHDHHRLFDSVVTTWTSAWFQEISNS